MPIPSKFAPMNNTNVTSLLDLAKYDDNITGGLFFPVILMVIFTISFIAMYRVDKSKSFVASLFLTWIISLMFWAVGGMYEWVMILLSVCLLFYVMYLVYANVKGDN
jgi:Ca2+/Na+ antiporter